MENSVHTNALRDTLNEISNSCPEAKNILLFKENGDVINGKETLKETAENLVDSLVDVLGEAAFLGGMQNMSFIGANGIVNVSHMDEYYLVMVVRNEADLTHLTSLTNILVPTVLKVLKRIDPTSETAINEHENEQSAETASIKMNDQIAELKEPPKESEQHSESTGALQANTEKILPEPQVNQFIVEHIGGIFASPDVARIDNNALSQWKELYEDTKIEEVDIESFGGKSTRCKIKPIRDSKFEGKGIIQIPEKIRRVLEIKKGELVRAKPVIE